MRGQPRFGRTREGRDLPDNEWYKEHVDRDVGRVGVVCAVKGQLICLRFMRWLWRIMRTCLRTLNIDMTVGSEARCSRAGSTSRHSPATWRGHFSCFSPSPVFTPMVRSTIIVRASEYVLYATTRKTMLTACAAHFPWRRRSMTSKQKSLSRKSSSRASSSSVRNSRTIQRFHTQLRNRPNHTEFRGTMLHRKRPIHITVCSDEQEEHRKAV